jgi:hypothetical protein
MEEARLTGEARRQRLASALAAAAPPDGEISRDSQGAPSTTAQHLDCDDDGTLMGGARRRMAEESAAAVVAASGEPMAVEASSGDNGISMGPALPYPAHPVPSDEDARLGLLHNLNVLGVRIEQFDPLVREAARLFATPISAISMVDVERQWFVAQKGLDVNETERTAAFCGHAIMPQATIPFIVPDTHRDPRFRENRLVTGPPYIRFYCGMPVYVGGIKLGTLCVIDSRTRSFQRADFVRVVNALGQLSRLISRMLVRRATTPHPAQANLVSAQPGQAGAPGAGESGFQARIGDHMATTLDMPLTSLDVGSPLYRAFGMAGGPGSGLGEEADCWRSFGVVDFATLIGQLLEVVDSNYRTVAAAGSENGATEASRVAEFRRQKGDLMLAKFADLWDKLESTEEGLPTNSTHLEMHGLVSSPSLFLQLAPKIAAWSRANDATVAARLGVEAQPNSQQDTLQDGEQECVNMS